MISGHGDMETYYTMRLGAFDYISNDLNRNDWGQQSYRSY
jgi:hypothetical protein